MADIPEKIDDKDLFTSFGRWLDQDFRKALVERYNNHAKLVKALEFYANEDNYDDNGAPFTEHQEHGQGYEQPDLGDKAREALGIES